MIALIPPEDPRLGEAAGEPLLLALIQGLAKTAGPGLRRELWLVTDQDPRREAPLGVVCRTEHGLLATTAGEGEAVREAADFLGLLGSLPATVDRGLAALLPGEWERLPVLRYQGEKPEAVPLRVPSAMELADHNVAAGTISPGAREELYAELHLRLRRGAARLYLVSGEDGGPAAGACLLLGREGAVIGYLACPPEKQRRGHGSAALSAAVRGAMEERKIPLLACREGLVPFYTGRGFVPAGEVWERRRPGL